MRFIILKSLRAHSSRRTAVYYDIDVTPEDEEELIKKIANEIHKRGLDLFAILTLETFKPLSYVGTQLGRAFISPFLPAFGDDIGLGGEKAMQVFEKRENVEKLLTILEELAEEDERSKKEAKKAAKSEEGSEKQGWRKFIPF